MSMTRGPYGAIFLGGKPASGLAFKLESYDKRKQTTSGITVEHKVGESFNQRLSIGYDVNQISASLYAPVGFWNVPSGEFREVEWSHYTTSFDYGANYRKSFRGGEITTTTSAGFQGAQDVDKRVPGAGQRADAGLRGPEKRHRR
jgi:hypothetical protein